MSRKRRPTTYDLKNDDLENDDLENDDLENDNLENDDLETTTSKTMTRKRWPRKRRPRKPILIDNNQTKKMKKKKAWAEDLYKGKGRHLKRSLVRGEPLKLAGPVPVRSFRYFF